MKTTKQLVAAGAIALAAFAGTSIQAHAEPYVQAGEGFFQGNLAITPGKYVSVNVGVESISATINPVTFSGKIVTQNTDVVSAEVPSTVSSSISKLTNADILLGIYGGNATAAQGASLVWFVPNGDLFETGTLAGLKVIKSGRKVIGYQATLSQDAGDLISTTVITNRSTKYKKGAPISVTTTATSFITLSFNLLSDLQGVAQVSSVYDVSTEVHSTRVNLPLSGLILNTPQ